MSNEKKFEEVLLKLTQMTQLIEKKALEGAGQEEVAAMEVFGREREQQIDNRKHKEIMLEEGDIPAGSGSRNW